MEKYIAIIGIYGSAVSLDETDKGSTCTSDSITAEERSSKPDCTLSALSIRRSTAEEGSDKLITNCYNLIVKRFYLTTLCPIGEHGGGSGRGQTYGLWRFLAFLCFLQLPEWKRRGKGKKVEKNKSINRKSIYAFAFCTGREAKVNCRFSCVPNRHDWRHVSSLDALRCTSVDSGCAHPWLFCSFHLVSFLPVFDLLAW